MKTLPTLLATVTALALSACQVSPEREARDSGWRYSEPLHYRYDGISDDLLTAGLGIEGIRGDTPALADPANPTREELRRLAYYNNYRALMDTSERGGFTRLFGPPVDQQPVPGDEYWALGTATDGLTHTLLLQVPDAFPSTRPCLVVGPSSGSRGVLGAIATAGDWGLRHDCAVVYTDKGAGAALSGFNAEQVMDITGRWGTAEELGTVEPFSRRYAADHADQPTAVAVKHAHSGHNPEGRWGEMTLHAVHYALDLLSVRHPNDGRPWTPSDLSIIAASVSNGGGSVLHAGEADEQGLLDGIVASEPNIWPGGTLTLAEAAQPIRTLDVLPLFDFATTAWLYEACATAGPDFGGAPLAMGQMQLLGLLGNRCEGLARAGLIAGDDLPTRSRSAQRKLLDAGLHPEAMDAQPFNTLLNIWGLVAAVYAPAYARVEYPDTVCDTAFYAFDAAGVATTPDPTAIESLFGTSAGVPPVAGVDLASVAGEAPVKLILATSDIADGKPAYGLDEALCARGLSTDPENGLGPKVRDGISATRAHGDVNGTPTLLLHGRSDALVWVNHTSRAYFAAHHQRVSNPSLRYIEVVNAQHFDTALSFADVGARFVPLHYYFEQAMDRMWAHLTEGVALPPSQVVPARARGKAGGLAKLEEEHVPTIQDQAGDLAITVDNGTLRIPR